MSSAATKRKERTLLDNTRALNTIRYDSNSSPSPPSLFRLGRLADARRYQSEQLEKERSSRWNVPPLEELEPISSSSTTITSNRQRSISNRLDATTSSSSTKVAHPTAERSDDSYDHQQQHQQQHAMQTQMQTLRKLSGASTMSASTIATTSPLALFHRGNQERSTVRTSTTSADWNENMMSFFSLATEPWQTEGPCLPQHQQNGTTSNDQRIYGPGCHEQEQQQPCKDSHDGGANQTERDTEQKSTTFSLTRNASSGNTTNKYTTCGVDQASISKDAYQVVRDYTNLGPLLAGNNTNNKQPHQPHGLQNASSLAKHADRKALLGLAKLAQRHDLGKIAAPLLSPYTINNNQSFHTTTSTSTPTTLVPIQPHHPSAANATDVEHTPEMNSNNHDQNKSPIRNTRNKRWWWRTTNQDTTVDHMKLVELTAGGMATPESVPSSLVSSLRKDSFELSQKDDTPEPIDNDAHLHECSYLLQLSQLLSPQQKQKAVTPVHDGKATDDVDNDEVLEGHMLLERTIMTQQASAASSLSSLGHTALLSEQNDQQHHEYRTENNRTRRCKKHYTRTIQQILAVGCFVLVNVVLLIVRKYGALVCVEYSINLWCDRIVTTSILLAAYNDNSWSDIIFPNRHYLSLPPLSTLSFMETTLTSTKGNETSIMDANGRMYVSSKEQGKSTMNVPLLSKQHKVVHTTGPPIPDSHPKEVRLDGRYISMLTNNEVKEEPSVADNSFITDGKYTSIVREAMLLDHVALPRVEDFDVKEKMDLESFDLGQTLVNIKWDTTRTPTGASRPPLPQIAKSTNALCLPSSHHTESALSRFSNAVRSNLMKKIDKNTVTWTVLGTDVLVTTTSETSEMTSPSCGTNGLVVQPAHTPTRPSKDLSTIQSSFWKRGTYSNRPLARFESSVSSRIMTFVTSTRARTLEKSISSATEARNKPGYLTLDSEQPKHFVFDPLTLLDDEDAFLQLPLMEIVINFFGERRRKKNERKKQKKLKQF